MQPHVDAPPVARQVPLRHKLALRFLLLAFVPAMIATIAIAWIAGELVTRQIEQRIEASFPLIAEQVALNLDRDIANRMAAIATLAAHRSVSAGATAAERFAALDGYQRQNNLPWIGIVDLSGKVTVTTEPARPGTDVSGEPWFRPGLASPTVTERRNPVTPETRDEPRTLDIAAPIKDDQGRVTGVLVAQTPIAFDPFKSPLPPTAAREQIAIMVYSPQRGLQVNTPGIPDAASLRAPHTRSLVRGFERARLGGVEYVTGFARSLGNEDFPGFAWTIAIRQPSAAAFAPAAELRAQLLQFGLALAVLASIPAAIAGARIARRLHSMRAAAEEIRAGNIAAAMPGAHGENELDRACESVFDLVEELRRRPVAPSTSAVPAPVLLPPSPETSPEEYRTPTGTDPRRVIW